MLEYFVKNCTPDFIMGIMCGVWLSALSITIVFSRVKLSTRYKYPNTPLVKEFLDDVNHAIKKSGGSDIIEQSLRLIEKMHSIGNFRFLEVNSDHLREEDAKSIEEARITKANHKGNVVLFAYLDVYKSHTFQLRKDIIRCGYIFIEAERQMRRCKYPLYSDFLTVATMKFDAAIEGRYLPTCQILSESGELLL